jgi:hypothetical protein
VVDGIGTTNSQLQGVIDGIGVVATNILGLKSGSTGGTTSSAGSSSSSSSSGSSSSGSSSSSSSSSSLPSTSGSLGNNGVGTDAQKKANADKLASDAAYVAAEKARTDAVIAARKAAGLDTSEQEKYKDKLGTYHTGGIAGLMNFVNGKKLQSNEVSAILQKEETVLQKGQLGSLIDHVVSTIFEGGTPSNGNTGIFGGRVTTKLPEIIMGGISSDLSTMPMPTNGNGGINPGGMYTPGAGASIPTMPNIIPMPDPTGISTGFGNVSVNVQVSGVSGEQESIWQDAFQRAVETAVAEVQRAMRLDNLRNKGVGY